MNIVLGTEMGDKKLRVLWFCNCSMSDSDLMSTGTWLHSMARGLLDAKQIELGIIALGSVAQLTRRDYGQVNQWIVPVKSSAGSNGLPSRTLVDGIVSACQSFSPDLIHVWGTESFWGLLPSRGFLRIPSILTLQGVRHRIVPCYNGGLTRSERRACLGLKEIIKAMMLRKGGKSSCEKWGPIEAEIMAGHRWAICQTPWQEAQMASNRPDATVFHLDLPLRKSFEKSERWKPHAGEPRIFCCASHWYPPKGLHVAIRSLALLKRRFPNVQLRIGGDKGKKGIFRDGYIRWLDRLVRKMGLGENVYWLGSLTASQIADEFRNSSVVLIPTFIESYCMVFAEAMRIGTPTVVSYTGGTAYLGKDDETCLFFVPGDEAMCAYQLARALSDRDLAARLSSASRQIAAQRHDLTKIVQEQLNIYQHVLTDSQGVATGLVGHQSSGNHEQMGTTP
jgi:glycosyltransferase involved in cell wall biosynthesis